MGHTKSFLSESTVKYNIGEELSCPEWASSVIAANGFYLPQIS